ncbi:beta-lactamase/transpeptidase-like protein [Gautieria morchelliformis]|nr:beta-lactamase/transpeptidase-like protein [Gautieria morchelliformis]
MKGVAIAVTRRNKDGEGWTTETKGFGVADRWGNPVDDQTLFGVGSNSKLFTALGVGLLTANESIPIAWDTKIKDILPETLWALQDPIAQEHADLVDILSHRTGLPRHDLSHSLHDTPESSVTKLRYLRPSTEFRQTWQYNNHMYALGAHIISHVTGTPFEQYITQNIILPLDLNSTTYNITEAEQSGKIAEAFLDTGSSGLGMKGDWKIRFKPIPFWTKKGGGEVLAGAGGIISNAKDMATWLQTLLLSGRSPYTNDTVIPPSVVERVTDRVAVLASRGPVPELSPSVYGMGQIRYTYQGHEFIEHNGETIGHYSIVTRSAHDGLGVAILVNAMSDPALLQLIKWRLLEKSLALKQIDWDKR